ncbi:MAG TPA: hypothetical protein VFC63_25030 [Blastocatellia bacterium]|nr:hypothetical protein [Blastocatellia bacterium]
MIALLGYGAERFFYHNSDSPVVDRTFESRLAKPVSAVSSKDPDLPQTTLNTAFKQPSGKTITVTEGGALQAAINKAKPGDSIVLDAGATFTAPAGGFILPAKADSRSTDWIVIRTSKLTAIPAEGERVIPEKHSQAMPKIVSADSAPALGTEKNAHYYRIIGIEFTVEPTVKSNTALVRLGDSEETDVNNVPHDIIIDRCYIHGNKTGAMRRGVALNSARTAVIDSYISEFHDSGQDTQAVCGWNGPGPFKIVNNYLEATGENVMFGGADPSIKGLTPSDIEFRQNYCCKPLAWKNDNSNKWVTKNLFELKNARRVLVEGNTFENSWVSGQTGFAILFKSSNQDGKAPWSITEHVTFKDNIVRHASSAINILGREHNTDHVTNNILIANNLFDDIDARRWGGSGIFLQITESPNVRVDHNTVFQSGNVITAYGTPSTGFVFTDNIIRHNTYGVKGDARGTGNDTIRAYFPDATFSNNVIAGLPGGVSASVYPPGNFFPAGVDSIKFADGQNGNYRLDPASPFKSAAIDGTAVGCNLDELDKAKHASSRRSTFKSAAANQLVAFNRPGDASLVKLWQPR